MFGCDQGRGCGPWVNPNHHHVIAPPVDVEALDAKDKKYWEAFNTFDLDKSGYGESHG